MGDGQTAQLGAQWEWTTNLVSPLCVPINYVNVQCYVNVNVPIKLTATYKGHHINLSTEEEQSRLLEKFKKCTGIIFKTLWKSRTNSSNLRCNYNHRHKTRKESLEPWAVFSWILIWTWNFGGDWSDSASTFFKIASASWFWCYSNYNWLFYMLDNDNIISTSVSEAVQKIPTDEKDCKRSFVLLCTATAVTKSRPTYS